MKKVLLSLVVLTSLSASAQTFTVDDTLAAGNSQTYFVADSNAVDLNAVTGTGLTWDYSGLMKYALAPNLDTVINAIDSPDAANFPTAQHNDVMNGGSSIFFTNYPDSVITNGYTFIIDGNEIRIKHSTDPMKSMELPMSQGDTFQDSIYGEIDAPDYMISGDPTLGQVTVTADGTGTLNLGTSSFTNVIRIELVEILEATINVAGTDYDGDVTRTVYSYYDLANQKEPIMLHATILVVVPIAGLSLGYTAVYSSVDLPELGAGLNIEDISTLDIYPNPASDAVNVSVPENSNELTIINSLGQTVYTLNNPSGTETIDLKELNSGVYFVQIEKDGAIKSKKLVIK